MTPLSPLARIAAGLIALVTLAGLAIRFTVSLGLIGSVPETLWTLYRYFTIIGNSLTALVLLGAALGLRRCRTPGMLGGVTLIMGLIGVVYAIMLAAREHHVGAAAVANIIMHYAVPVLVALFWLAFAPKGGLVRLDPLRWTILPLAYFPYAILRAQFDGKYPYPFLDVGKIGWGQVLVNVVVIAAFYLLFGLLLVGIDRMMARSRRMAVPA